MKITLTKQGEAVLSQKNTPDNEKLSFGLKQHNVCLGFMNLTKVSKTHQALSCRCCNFRFVFPIGIDTWLKLKQCMEKVKK